VKKVQAFFEGVVVDVKQVVVHEKSEDASA